MVNSGRKKTGKIHNGKKSQIRDKYKMKGGDKP